MCALVLYEGIIIYFYFLSKCFSLRNDKNKMFIFIHFINFQCCTEKNIFYRYSFFFKLASNIVTLYVAEYKISKYIIGPIDWQVTVKILFTYFSIIYYTMTLDHIIIICLLKVIPNFKVKFNFQVVLFIILILLLRVVYIMFIKSGNGIKIIWYYILCKNILLLSKVI